MRFIKSNVVFVVLFCLSNVKAIFDAHEAVVGQFPYHASITVWRNTTARQIKKFATWHCSGAIISSKLVLTSYKCVTGPNFDGSWPGTEFRIKTDCLNYMNETCTELTTRLAPKTTPEQVIALIKLHYNQEILFNDRVQPVTLPAHNNQSTLFFDIPNASSYATGYITNQTTPIRQTEDVLRFLIMKIVRLYDCMEHFPGRIITSSLICVQGLDMNGQNSQGSLCTELGVPLVHLYTTTLIGIFDHTDSNCTIGGPNFFIKIESFVDWINRYKG